MLRLLPLLAALVVSLLAVTEAHAQSCDRLRVSSHKGDARLEGLYDFCNEYRRLQDEVRHLTQQVQTLEQNQRQAERRRQLGGNAVPVAEVVRGADGAQHGFSVSRPAVLLATAYGKNQVALMLDGKACAAGADNATCQRPLDPGKHKLAATGTDVVLSVVVVVR